MIALIAIAAIVVNTLGCANITGAAITMILLVGSAIFMELQR